MAFFFGFFSVEVEEYGVFQSLASHVSSRRQLKGESTQLTINSSLEIKEIKEDPGHFQYMKYFYFN